MKIGMDVVEAAGAKREQWDRETKAAIQQARSVRMRRREKLDTQAAAITRATAKYEQLDDENDHPEVRIRKRFVRLASARPPREDDPQPKTARELVKADVDSRPPLSRLLYRPSNALQVYLSLIYIAHLEFEPGARWANERDNTGVGGWGELCGLLAPSVPNRELNLRMTRALAKLADHDLVGVGAWKSRSRFDGFSLYREDLSRKPYLVPAAEESVILPAGFFRAGWHLVLTGEEMATLLAVIAQWGRPRSRKDADGVALPQLVRWQFYGLAPEAFAARHELEEFGLIDMVDPMDRTDGKLSATQRQADVLRAPRITPKLDEVDFSRKAIDVVAAALKKPLPPRWVDRATALRLLDNSGRWQEPGSP
ncbi:hypothetical protein AB431_15385 [Mycobacterium sp. EPa45]|nr:hypothetical protein AB431_15385 [Mycobacterium sp. EPa45]